jgi:hypothetical protein
MKVKITQEHIDQGIQSLRGPVHYRADQYCPTCFALREAFPEAKEVSVGFDLAFIDGRMYTVNHPEWIHNFIDEQPVQPTEFELVLAWFELVLA